MNSQDQPRQIILQTIGPEELLTTIKEFAQWHHLNEMTITKGGTPSDSEIDFEVILWTEIKKAIGAA